MDLHTALNDFLQAGHDGFAARPDLMALCALGVGVLIALVIMDIVRWSIALQAHELTQAALMPVLADLTSPQHKEGPAAWDPLTP